VRFFNLFSGFCASPGKASGVLHGIAARKFGDAPAFAAVDEAVDRLDMLRRDAAKAAAV
jgi:hypothetical protein